MITTSELWAEGLNSPPFCPTSGSEGCPPVTSINGVVYLFYLSFRQQRADFYLQMIKFSPQPDEIENKNGLKFLRFKFNLEQARAKSWVFLSDRFLRGWAASGLLVSVRSSLTAPSEWYFLERVEVKEHIGESLGKGELNFGFQSPAAWFFCEEERSREILLILTEYCAL